MVLSTVWPLISNFLHLLYKTKIQSPLTVTVAVIVPRLTIDRQKVIPKWGSGFSPFKSQSRGQVGRKEHLLYFGCQYVVGRRVGTWPKADCPLPRERMDKSFYRQRERVTCRNSRVSTDSHFEIHNRCLTNVILIKYSYSSVSGLICSHYSRSILRTVAAYVSATVWPSRISFTWRDFQYL